MGDKPFKQFLTCDQNYFDGIMLGAVNFSFYIDGKTLFIKKVDHDSNELTLEAPIEKAAEHKCVLESFLIEYMSHRSGYGGRPEFLRSEFFTNDEFEAMLSKGFERMHLREQAIINAHKDNIFIQYCRTSGLSPEPHGSSSTNWKANCPSGGQHWIYISTISNQWGCGYCKKKGKLDALKDWININRAKKS